MFILPMIMLLSTNAIAGPLIDDKAKVMNKHVNLSIAFLEAANATGVDVKLLRAVCFVESSHNPNVVVLMDYNAPSYGICQVQFRTAKELGFKGSVKDLMYAPLNIYFAAKYLATMLKKTKGDRNKAIMAYNHGHIGPAFGPYAAKVLIAISEGR